MISNLLLTQMCSTTQWQSKVNLGFDASSKRKDSAWRCACIANAMYNLDLSPAFPELGTELVINVPFRFLWCVECVAVVLI